MTLMQMIMILYLGQWHDSDKKRIMEEYSTAAVAIWKWVNSATWRWCRDGDNFFEILNHHLQLSTAGTFTLPIKFLTDSFWNENIIVKIYHCHCIALGKLLFDQFSNVYDVWEYGYGLLPPWPSMSAVSPSLPWRLLSVESWQTTEHLHFTQLSTHCSSMGQHCDNIGQSWGAMWG